MSVAKGVSPLGDVSVFLMGLGKTKRGQMQIRLCSFCQGRRIPIYQLFFFFCFPPHHFFSSHLASQVALVVKNPPANSRDISDVGLIPGSGRSTGRRHGNPLQYSCLEKPMTEEPGGLQSIGLQRVRDDCSDIAHTCSYGQGCKYKCPRQR